MSKVKDNNGFWEIKHNPISKVGVFPYLGRSISDECEPNKVYYVYRPATTLSQSVETWDNPPKPFINDHEMLGEGFSKIDDRPVQGVIHNPVFEDDILYADISVYSESLKKKIEDGKKELSLGYFCKYRKEKGVYKGQAYDYVQEDMVGNHIALVDNGRCGSDVKVFDSKCTMDSLDITASFESGEDSGDENGVMTETKERKMKYISVDDVKTILDEALEEEKAKEVSEKVEEKATDEEEKSEKEEEKKAEDKCGKDEEKEEEKKESEDSDEEEEKKAEDEEVSPADVMAFLKMILEEVRSINGKKTTDEEEKKEDSEEEKKSEDEDEEKKSEDEDEEEEKKTEDSAIVVQFAKDGAEKPVSLMDDPALRKYLGL